MNNDLPCQFKRNKVSQFSKETFKTRFNFTPILFYKNPAQASKTRDIKKRVINKVFCPDSANACSRRSIGTIKTSMNHSVQNSKQKFSALNEGSKVFVCSLKGGVRKNISDRNRFFSKNEG